MTMTGTSVTGITEELSSDIVSAVNWCKRNKMTVNILKTNAMFPLSAQRQSQLQDNAPKIRIGDDQINISNGKEKLLGVIVDTLYWSTQVEATLEKCNSLLYLLGRIKTFLNLSTLIPFQKLHFRAMLAD